MSRPAPTAPLALFGGEPTITQPLPPFHSVGEEEAAAAAEVVRSGVLSAYIGAPGEFFLGGPRVRAFEEQAARHFGVRHAVAVNSWTSGLEACVGAIGVEPGDEIITSPWTMAASATAILHWNAIPVFADIDRQSFNIDPVCVERLVSPRTRAILAVDIFGQSADMRALRAVAERHGLKLLVDTAQSPGARVGDRFAGTLADIGGYSLNYHKHIHCGEGGIVVTDDDRLAQRARLIRNHAECVVPDGEASELANMIGHNFRMGEIEAAIASLQLGKLAGRVASRQRAAAAMDRGLAALPGLRTPTVSEGNTHVYYVYGMTLDTQALGVPRARLLEALRAEGVPGLFAGYQNIHLLPLFQRKIAYGTGGFPWTSPYASREISYERGICPVAEELHATSFLGLNLCMHEYTEDDVQLMVAAFHTVWAQLDRLRAAASAA
jgi:dTDP-4-amino-4,6-dideoxygalactose transaminase